jgi:CubicO group peptidase (beta-lactamase class C family)
VAPGILGSMVADPASGRPNRRRHRVLQLLDRQGRDREDLCDWDKMSAAIADAELWWEPGTKVGYHAYTFGYIVGELARRATGKPISQILREEVAGPLGVADELWFGMPASEHHRLARLEDEPGAAEMAAQMMASMPPDLPMFRSAPPELFPNAEFANRADVLAADIPAGGKTSARACHYRRQANRP